MLLVLSREGCIENSTTFQDLKGANREVRQGLSIRNCTGRTQRNEYKLKEGQFRLDIRKK